jgi:S-DNA-T family DNA segregation ATPase FtsK/SpoIIIE
MALPPDNIIIKRSNGIAPELRSASGMPGASAEAPAPKANKSRPKKTENITSPEPEKPRTGFTRERQIHILALFLGLFSILLFLALISYTQRDEANAELTVHDILGIIRGEEAIRARADTTQNWLGLFGAVIANLLYNHTVGFSAILFPFIAGWWSIFLLRQETIPIRVLRITGIFLILTCIFSGLMGTLQLWFPGISNEWSGAIGQFEAHVLSSLLGKIGSFLLLLVCGFLTIVLGTDISIRTVAEKALEYLMAAKEKIQISFSRPMPDQEEDIAISPTEAGTTQPVSRPNPTIPDLNEVSDEPARMVRKGISNDPAGIVPPAPETSTLGGTPTAPSGNGSLLQKSSGFSNTTITRPTPVIIRGTAFTDTPGSPALIPTPQPITTASPAESTHSPTPVQSAPQRIPVTIKVSEPRGNKQELPPQKVNTTSVITSAPAKMSGPAKTGAVQDNKKADTPISPAHQTDPAQEPPKLTVNVQEPKINTLDTATVNPGQAVADIQDEEIFYIPPTLELLRAQNEQAVHVDDEELKENARLLQEKLLTFKIPIEDLTVTPGPVVTQYEFVPAAGIKVAQIENLADDIALALKARGIRIIAPVPGRGTVAIEIPNHNPSTVLFSSIIKSPKFNDKDHRLPLALGKTISGEVYCADLTKMPHLLIAGSTGSGKSVGINTVICSLLYRMHPRDLKFVIIDPKKVEMTYYGFLRNHFLALSPDSDEHIITTPQNAAAALKSLVAEMMRRYEILAKVGQRNIVDYNQKVKDGKYKDSTEIVHRPLPYIVCIIDELADLMLTAKAEVEEPIIRLAQLARAVGIHMIVATQRPSVDVITGLIKANFPARISYQVASKIDSRTIIDGPGADQLLGNGDMLFLPGGAPKPVRIQNSFLSTDEVEEICMHIAHQKGYSQPFMLPTAVEKKEGGKGGLVDDSRDELFEEAARIVVQHQQGSVSLLQRRLKVGYARAARIMDELEAAGIVGPFDGSKAREVMLSSESELEAFL